MKTNFVIRALKGSSARGSFDDAELTSYADSFRDPARAHAAVGLYRYYLRQTSAGCAASGSWQTSGLTVPTLLLFGKRDLAISPKLVRDGWQSHADDMTVEFADAGHFIVNEQPELVAAHARAFLA